MPAHAANIGGDQNFSWTMNQIISHGDILIGWRRKPSGTGQ